MFNNQKFNVDLYSNGHEYLKLFATLKANIFMFFFSQIPRWMGLLSYLLLFKADYNPQRLDINKWRYIYMQERRSLQVSSVCAQLS